MDTNIIWYLCIAGAILCIALWLLSLELRLKRFMRGKKGANLESVLRSIATEVDQLQRGLTDTKDESTQLRTQLQQSIRGIAIKRFNPFQNTGGGNQSFAIALLDENGDGVVLSSLYARERTRVYAKPISSLSSEFDLTDEEQAVIDDAQQQL